MKFSEEARNALIEGVKRQDSVAELEYLGLNPRFISVLDTYGIVYVSELLALSKEDFASLSGLGAIAYEEIVACLSRYEFFVDAKKYWDAYCAYNGLDIRKRAKDIRDENNADMLGRKFKKKKKPLVSNR